MRSREVGLYEASDILLGDHLHEKSATVQWIGADMPHKRKWMLKNHSELKAMAAKNPIAEDICDLASKNRPYDIFNPNGVISMKL